MNSIINEIENSIKKASIELAGPLGIGFEDLQTNLKYYYNGDKLFPTASVFKIFVLAELFNQIDKGEVSLNDRFELKEYNKSPGSGVMFQMSSGTYYTIYDYALLMMILSDNTAADYLYHFVGVNNIYNNVIRPLGLNDTKVDLSCAELFTCYCHTDKNATPAEQFRAYNTGNFLYSDYYKCTQEKNDVTTSIDMNKILRTLYDGKWCNSNISDQALDIMKKCQTNSRIPKYLPPGTVVAHKTGTFDRLVNDCGIVYTDVGDYILTMFYNGNLSNEEEYHIKNKHGYYGDEVLAHLSKEIFDIFTQSK